MGGFLGNFNLEVHTSAYIKMIFRRFIQFSATRTFHSSSQLSASSPLAALRKKTGYSISNCKKALEINANDLLKAEGWLKAAKLQSRTTRHGLIGISQNHIGVAMVEINCETDFVARNEKFQSLVAEAARACARNLPIDCSGTHQINYNSEELGDLKTSEEISTKLSDLVALNIGQIGENMNLRRGASIGSADKNIKLAYSSHPSQSVEEVLVGKYGAVVAYEESVDQPESLKDLPENVTVEKLPRQLCQHIIGMNPKTLNRTEQGAEVSSDEETALYHQEFVSDPEYTVGEILQLAGWKVHAFLRFECGEE